MKSFVPSLIFILCVVYTAQSQTFFPVNGPLHEQEVAFEQANLCYIYFNNPSGDSLRLRWRRLEMSTPTDWTVGLCDYGHCYLGIPTTALMDYIYDDIQGELKLIINPKNIAGSAWFWFRVAEEGNPDNFQDVYYNLYTPGTTAAHDPQGNQAFQVFPNPASEFVMVKNGSTNSAKACLSDQTGRIIGIYDLQAKSMTSISLESVSNGIYFLRTGNSVQKISVQK
ncbi:MAG: T9SS type A sorting domain-containing protein [Bacteroidota bacterium]